MTSGNGKTDQGSAKQYPDLRSNGLYYMHRQRTMVFIPVIFGIFTLIVQGFNIFFVNGMAGFNRPPPNLDGSILPNQLQPPPPIDLATPAIIFLIFALFLLIKVLFLIRLRKITHAFESKTSVKFPRKARSEN